MRRDPFHFVLVGWLSAMSMTLGWVRWVQRRQARRDGRWQVPSDWPR